MALNQPIISMPFEQYVVLWSGEGLLCLALFLGLAIPVYRRSGLPES
jgi:hypothetical protein